MVLIPSQVNPLKVTSAAIQVKVLCDASQLSCLSECIVPRTIVEERLTRLIIPKETQLIVELVC
jgi:hypothetical protein